MERSSQAAIHAQLGLKAVPVATGRPSQCPSSATRLPVHGDPPWGALLVDVVRSCDVGVLTEELRQAHDQAPPYGVGRAVLAANGRRDERGCLLLEIGAGAWHCSCFRFG